MRAGDGPAAPAAGRTRADAFAATLRGTLNQAMLALMVAVGHRAGLFETLAGLGTATSGQLAAARALDEPALRAWLGAMVTGKVVDYDGARDTYRLPPEHTAALVGTGPNLAALADAMATAAPTADEVMARLEGRGRPPRSPGDAFADALAPLAPRLEAGLDVRLLSPTPGFAERLRRRFPRIRFRKVVDLVVLFEPLAAMSDPAAALATARRQLRPHGLLLLRQMSAASHLSDDVDHPYGAILYGAATLAGGAAAPWGAERTRAALSLAGFADITVQAFPADPLHAYYLATARS